MSRHAGNRHLTGRVLVVGLLWGLGITSGETLTQPIRALTSMPDLFASWLVAGVLMAWIGLGAEPWLDRSWKIALAVVGASLSIAAADLFKWRVFGALDAGIDRVLASESASSSLFLYMFWMTLFHGGLFVVICVLAMRAERTRLVLGAAQIARDRSQALLDAAQLEALHGGIDPVFLLRAITAIRDRYAIDAPGAERLLDALVAFLRLAMPGVRSGRSTLTAELALARAYVELFRRIEPGHGRWRIDVDGPLPDLAFPPLLLLPLIDALAQSASHGPGARLRVSCERSRLTIAFDAGAGDVGLPAPLRYRAQVALQATFGHAWSLAFAAPQGRSADRTLELAIEYPVADPARSGDASVAIDDAGPAALAPLPVPPPLHLSGAVP